ncbi:hypothetical protein Emag_004961 [Eimeria magna]
MRISGALACGYGMRSDGALACVLPPTRELASEPLLSSKKQRLMLAAAAAERLNWKHKLAGKLWNCPLSRPSLQLIRKGGSKSSGRLPPVWLFAHDIGNFQELVRLQKERIRDADTSDARKGPSPGNLTPLIVNVFDANDGSSQGVALFHSRPLIAARFIEGLPVSRCIDTGFMRERLLAAASRRRALQVDGVSSSSSLASSPLQASQDSSADFGVEIQREADASVQRPTRSSIPAGFYRLINGENDGLPGLVVDLFGNVVTVQQLTRGSELLTAPLLKALQELAEPEAVVLRNDSLERQLERDPVMKQYSAVVMGHLDGWRWVQEGGSVFPVDLLNSPDTALFSYDGHPRSLTLCVPRKPVVTLGVCFALMNDDLRLADARLSTGWYYDRRDVRLCVARLAKGSRVLDLHSHSGAFSVSALREGARSAVCVDTSSLSLKLAAAAAEANTVKDKVLLYQDDALRWLRRQANQQAAAPGSRTEDESAHTATQFDLVILDPPAPHRRGLLPAFTHELQELATAAAAITSRGGRLVVVNSSRFVHLQQFLHLLSAAVSASGKAAVLEMHGGPTLDCPQDLYSQGAVGMNWVVMQLV